MSDTASSSSDRREFHRTLPRKRMGSGAVMMDGDGNVLLVNPTYKPGWELPGGVVEADESPADACRREVKEELGIDVEIGELLCVDYNRATADYVESLMFLFHVRSLSPEQAATMTLSAAEVSEFRFCTLDEAHELLPIRVARRLAAVLDGGSYGRYLEDQQSIC